MTAYLIADVFAEIGFCVVSVVLVLGTAALIGYLLPKDKYRDKDGKEYEGPFGRYRPPEDR